MKKLNYFSALFAGLSAVCCGQSRLVSKESHGKEMVRLRGNTVNLGNNNANRGFLNLRFLRRSDGGGRPGFCDGVRVYDRNQQFLGYIGQRNGGGVGGLNNGLQNVYLDGWHVLNDDLQVIGYIFRDAHLQNPGRVTWVW